MFRPQSHVRHWVTRARVTSGTSGVRLRCPEIDEVHLRELVALTFLTSKIGHTTDGPESMFPSPSETYRCRGAVGVRCTFTLRCRPGGSPVLGVDVLNPTQKGRFSPLCPVCFARRQRVLWTDVASTS